MNGAIAELLATINNKPTRTSVITIGASQNFLFSRMNCQSSRTTISLDIVVLKQIHRFPPITQIDFR